MSAPALVELFASRIAVHFPFRAAAFIRVWHGDQGCQIGVLGPNGKRRNFSITAEELACWQRTSDLPRGFLEAYVWSKQGSVRDEDDMMSDPDLLVDALHA